MAGIVSYPGSPIRAGNSVAVVIDQIQGALESNGIGGLTRGQFDAAMTSAVKLFQSRQVDQAGVPLKVDGVVGRFTWTALFGSPSTQATGIIAALPAQVLSVAITQIGVMENAGQPNRGPQVDAFLKAAGIGNPAANPPSGFPWCQAFIYWCFVQATASLGRANPAPRTAGVLEHWRLASSVAGAQRISRATALGNTSLVSTGQLLVLDHGSGQGHIAIVESVYPDGRIVTVEGNTNPEANREGLGVYRLERRKLTDIELKGFIDYGAA